MDYAGPTLELTVIMLIIVFSGQLGAAIGPPLDRAKAHRLLAAAHTPDQLRAAVGSLGRVLHLTQGRDKARMVEGNEYLLKLSRYIHLNPVCGKRWSGVSVENRREALRAYGWSTYRSYSFTAKHG